MLLKLCDTPWRMQFCGHILAWLHIFCEFVCYKRVDGGIAEVPHLNLADVPHLNLANQDV
jgi:hypothetical protein